MAVSAVAALISTAGAVGPSLLSAGGLASFGFWGLKGASAALAFFGASTAMGAALNALAPKPTASNSGYSVTSRGGNLSHQIIYGRTRVSGVVVAERLAGEGSNTGTRFLHQIIALAGHEIESFDEVYVDGKRVATWYEDPSSKTTDVTSIASYVDTDADIFIKDIYDVDEDGANTGDSERPFYDANNVSMRFFSGTDAQTASTAIQTDMFNGNSSLWGTNHRLRGIAYVHVIMGYDPNAFRNGVPEFAFTVKGKKVYDPRTASTAYSNNPALCLRDYLVSDYGLSEDTARIDDTLVTTAANVCETADTWNTDQYTCNGTFLTGGQPYDIMRDLLTSMGGRLWYAQGQWRMKAAAWTASVESFDEDDLRGPVQVQTRHSMRDNFNTVTGSFRGEQTAWAVTEYPPVSNATFVTEDNSRVTKVDVAFPFTENADMCRKLARIILERNREQLTLNLTLGLKGFKVQVGDIIDLTLERFSWTSKTFEVVDWSFGLANEGDLQTNVTVREIQSSVFDDVDDGVTYDGSNPTGTNTIGDITPEFISNTVTFDPYTGGTNLPVLTSVWTAGDVNSVDYYDFEFRLTEFDYSINGGEAAYPTSPTTREIGVWDAYVAELGRVPDADGYAFYVSGGGSGLTVDEVEDQLASSTEASSQTPFTSVRINNTRYELRGLVEDDIYDIRLRSVGFNKTKSKWIGDYVEIIQDVVAPAAPSSVAASSATFNTNEVSWTNPTTDENGDPLKDLDLIQVFASTSDSTPDDPDDLIGTIKGTSFTHTGLTAGATWYYRLKAVDYNGNSSDFSSVVSATVGADPTDTNTITDRIYTGRLYYGILQASSPGLPSLTGRTFNESTGKFNTLPSNWSHDQPSVSVTDTTKLEWSCLYIVTVDGSTTYPVTAVSDSSGSVSDLSSAIQVTTDIQSDNFSSGSAGWSIERDTGNVEFNNGTFRGDLVAGSITISDNPGVDTGRYFNADPEGSFQVVSIHNDTAGDNCLYLLQTAASEALFIQNDSTDDGIRVVNDSSSNTADAISVRHDGNGRGIYVDMNSTAGVSSSIDGPDGIRVESLGDWGSTCADMENTRTNAGHVQLALGSGNSGYGVYIPATSRRGGLSDASTGWSPFTGVHLGMKEIGPVFEEGDILVDKRVVAKSLSDTFTEVELSSSPNQKGAIGVMCDTHDDWVVFGAFIDKPATRERAERDADERKAIEEQLRAERKLYEDEKKAIVASYEGLEKKDPKVQKKLSKELEVVNDKIYRMRGIPGHRTEPVLRQDPSVYFNTHDMIDINSVGEGCVNVCGEGGDIEVGDLIVTSSVAGKGMKQADDIVRSYTVAKARETVTFKNKNEVKMIACIYMCG